MSHATNTLFDALLVGRCEAQANILVPTSVNVKWLADDEGNAFLRDLPEQGTSAHVTRQAAPEMEASRRVVDACVWRPVRLYRLQHGVALGMVARAQRLQVPLHQVFLQKFGDQPLAQGVGVQIEDLFVQGKSLDQGLRRDEPCYAQTWSEYFRERTQVENVVVGVECLQGLGRFALEV